MRGKVFEKRGPPKTCTRTCKFWLTEKYQRNANSCSFLDQNNRPTHMCELCGRMFAHAGLLDTHMKFHLKVKTKKCPDCAKMFTTSSHLNRHMQVHRNDKPFQWFVIVLIFRNIHLFYLQGNALFSKW